MPEEKRESGFLPGGEDRTQWVFEGEWTEEMKAPLLQVVIDHIKETRKVFGWDVTNYFTFSWWDCSPDLRIFYATRRQWRFHLSSENDPNILAEKLAQAIKRIEATP